jgi:hypothetical protein
VNADTSAGQSAPENCQEPVRYEDFGAVGDGKADDLQALAKAHAHANREGLPVRAKDGATYYLGGGKQQIVIQTDTDFGAAKFVIDDREVENHRAHVFVVRSKLEAFVPKGLRTLARNQAKIDVELPAPCLIQVSNSKVRRYIRYGRNQNKGSAQTDVFLVDAEGNVDPRAPIVWDFERITKVTAYPLDSETLTHHGGRFTTIANAAESKYSYYGRGIAVRRSRVVIDGLEHRITGEGEARRALWGLRPYRQLRARDRAEHDADRPQNLSHDRARGSTGHDGQLRHLSESRDRRRLRELPPDQRHQGQPLLGHHGLQLLQAAEFR